jgi:hypothetical protein
MKRFIFSLLSILAFCTLTTAQQDQLIHEKLERSGAFDHDTLGNYNFYCSKTISANGIQFTSFGFDSKNKDQESYSSFYGNGFLAWKYQSDSSIVPLGYGLLGVESVFDFHIMDINNDQKPDVLIRAGGCSYSSGHFFINQMKNETFSSENFKLVYNSCCYYPMLIDIDNDGVFELIDAGDSEESMDNSGICHLNMGPLKKEIIDYHKNMVLPSDTTYIKKYFSELEEWSNPLMTYDKIRILKYVDGDYNNVTTKFQSYLKWRKKVVEQTVQQYETDENYAHYRKYATPWLKEIISHLNQQIY